MIELSPERVEKILYEETVKDEKIQTILRSIYIRYMLLYEKYFEDIDALNDEKIAELRKYHEETRSLIKYYYMDIPQDICTALNEFENKYDDNLLGSEWHNVLFDSYKKFREKNTNTNKSEKSLKEEFTKQTLAAFYGAMDYVFREGFGTGSTAAQSIVSGITGLLFGKEK